MQNIRNLFHKLIDYLFSLHFLKLVFKILQAALFVICACFYPKILFFVLLVLAIIFMIAEYTIDRFIENKKIKKDYVSIVEYNKLKHKYISLFTLLGNSFDAQMFSLCENISEITTGYIRTSVYLYNDKKNNFYCLARHSNNPNYKNKKISEEYFNKGWLQSTWNNNIYEFSCDYKNNIKMWILKCKEECKKNCTNSSCKKRCVRINKKDIYDAENCSMLCEKELQNKSMKAKYVYGIRLNQGSKNLGIILVEFDLILDPNIKTRIHEMIKQYSHSAIEILSNNKEELLLFISSEYNKDLVLNLKEEI